MEAVQRVRAYSRGVALSRIRVLQGVSERCSGVGGAGEPNRSACQALRFAHCGDEYVDSAALGSWGSEFSLRDLPQRVLLQLGFGEQPLKLAVLLAQLLEFLRCVGVHTVLAALVVQRRCRHIELRSDLLLRPACSSELVARRSVRTMSSTEFRFRPAMFSIVISALFTGNKTLEQDGPIHRGYASLDSCIVNTSPSGIVDQQADVRYTSRVPVSRSLGGFVTGRSPRTRC